jgi:hypothetical protein
MVVDDGQDHVGMAAAEAREGGRDEGRQRGRKGPESQASVAARRDLAELPVGRACYGFSTLLCTPASLSQDVGLALGAQAGPARIAAVVAEAGFTRFRQVAETSFNLVFEARP